MASPTNFPGTVAFGGDTVYSAFMSAGLAVLQFDTNDYMYYDRAANTYNWDIGAGIMLTLDSAGKLTGTGFYRSTEVTITNGNNANFAHGLSAKPSNVYGVHGTVTTNNLTIIGQSSVTFGQIDGVNINVANASGATRFVLVMAIK
jgi:hypothetical protein